MQKTADTVGNTGHAPEMTSAAVPTVSVVPTTAPGKTGPHGLQQRTNYSRVNTGTIETNFGAEHKQTLHPGLQPKQAEFMTTPRPTLSQMTKQAAAGLSRASLLSHAAAQATGTEKVAEAPPQEGSPLSHAYLDKLASMLVLASEGKLAANPGEGPGALTVTESIGGPPINPDTGSARTQLPKPTLAKGETPASPVNQIKNDIDNPAGGSGTQQTSLPGPSKIAAHIVSLVKAAEKKEKGNEGAGAATHGLAGLMLGGLPGGLGAYHGHQRAVAAGADGSDGAVRGGVGATLGYGLGSLGGGGLGALLGSAHSPALAAALGLTGGVVGGIHGGHLGYDMATSRYDAKQASGIVASIRGALAKQAASTAPNSPTVSATGENTPAMPANAGQVATPQAIAALTRTQAHAQERADMRAYVDEPAQTSATDKTLQNALVHNTGSKIAGDPRTLAASAYLQALRASVGG